ncbi:MAG TPA: DEAD/DEAH box helicase, partial [Bacteroidetes bacterium]|nr:DEAD/DEAH box helicase [Bacteroidota bacterium]
MQQLLGLEPLTAFETIRDNFILYLKTAYRTRFKQLENEKDQLLKSPGPLFKPPYVELLPKYADSKFYLNGLGARELPELKGRIEEFKTLVEGHLFSGNNKLYAHQFKMLQQALAGRNCLITSGTGSGKTESFMLPLMASLVRESRHWPAADQPDPEQLTWFQDENANEDARISQRKHEEKGRPAAMRAMIVYPMNALVEDQLARLRKALDDTALWKKYEETFAGNRFYFGRYTGNTAVAGKQLEKSEKKTRKKKENLDYDENKGKKNLASLKKMAGAYRDLQKFLRMKQENEIPIRDDEVQ